MTATLLLPTAPRRMGPVTRFLVLRTVAVVLLVEVAGSVLVAAGGVRVDNAADYVAAGAALIATSAPYQAAPRDVQVRFFRAG